MTSTARHSAPTGWSGATVENKRPQLRGQEGPADSTRLLRKPAGSVSDTTSWGPEEKASALAGLTERERRIFDLTVLDSKLVKEIAYDLGISVATVGVNKRKMYAKLGLKSNSELISVFGDMAHDGTEQITLDQLRANPDMGREFGLGLSNRMEEVMALIDRGLRDKAIADALHISPSTAHTYTSNLFELLGLHDRKALIHWNRRRKQYLALINAPRPDTP
jgi:DNA-binding NarL/FixJ family response regulator